MPEGHTIHRIALDHRKRLVGQVLQVESPQGRFSPEAKRLNECKLAEVDAYGKHLIYRFGAKRLHVHLGLYGKFRWTQDLSKEPRGAVRVRMVGDEWICDLNGPNTCELLGQAELGKLLARLGPDPLRDDANPELAWQKISRSRAAIGTLLLNQAVIAGIGNIYRSEILHILEIHPDRLGKDISRNEFDAIWELAKKLMKIGVKYNRIITVGPESGKSLSRLRKTERLHVYNRASCPRCESTIYYWQLGNRTVFACDACQV